MTALEGFWAGGVYWKPRKSGVPTRDFKQKPDKLAQRQERRIAELLDLGLTLQEAISQVADERRRSIRRARQAGATLKEIAASLDISAGRVGQIYDEAMRRERLAPKGWSQGPLQDLMRSPGLTHDMMAAHMPHRRLHHQATTAEARERAEYERLRQKYG